MSYPVPQGLGTGLGRAGQARGGLAFSSKLSIYNSLTAYHVSQKSKFRTQIAAICPNLSHKVRQAVKSKREVKNNYMARERLSISLPPAAMLFVKERVDVEGYGSVSEYFRELVRVDQRLEFDRQNAAARRAQGDRGTFGVAGLPRRPKW